MKNIHNYKHLEERRKKLRESITPTKDALWKYLQEKQFKGRLFRRQHRIKNFVVDFYCATEKLIVELNAEVHLDLAQQNYEEERIYNIEKLGFTVVHIENELVFESIEEVLEKISSFFIKE